MADFLSPGARVPSSGASSRRTPAIGQPSRSSVPLASVASPPISPEHDYDDDAYTTHETKSM